MRPVAVNVLSGFLGSGKTTLLSSLLDGPLNGERVAVVMNEIGEVGVDAAVISGMEFVEDVVELNSGCICCTIDDYRFDVGMRELVEKVDPSLIIVECTGLADPGPVTDRVRQAGLGVDAVITVVDAANFHTHERASEVAVRQVEEADFVVVSKTDLVDSGALAKLRRRIKRLNGRALSVDARFGKVETDLIVGTSTRARRSEAAYSTGGRSASHVHDDGFETFVLSDARTVDVPLFERFLEKLPGSVYRAKGFVRVADNPWSGLFNYTCGRYELQWVKLGSAAGATQAVFIGVDLGRRRSTIEAGFERCLVGSAPGAGQTQNG